MQVRFLGPLGAPRDQGERFRVRRGLVQACPLSPLLFNSLSTTPSAEFSDSARASTAALACGSPACRTPVPRTRVDQEDLFEEHSQLPSTNRGHTTDARELFVARVRTPWSSNNGAARSAAAINSSNVPTCTALDTHDHEM
jgi:hypothetical protein